MAGFGGSGHFPRADRRRKEALPCSWPLKRSAPVAVADVLDTVSASPQGRRMASGPYDLTQ